MDRSKVDAWSSFKFSNEGDFERILLQKNLFKNLAVKDAKVSLNNLGGYNRYADVLIYCKEFKYWSIGEVEIAEHSFDSHIFPQVLELFTLIDRDLEFIQNQFLTLPFVKESKKLRDLIQFNKPFLTLVIDRFPVKYSSSINLLKHLCNISVVTRFKDDNENYIYAHDEYRMLEIERKFSRCLINDNLLQIERPNLIGMNNNISNHLLYNGEQIELSQHNGLINNQKKLFWIMSKSLRTGLYKIKLNQNELILSKR